MGKILRVMCCLVFLMSVLHADIRNDKPVVKSDEKTLQIEELCAKILEDPLFALTLKSDELKENITVCKELVDKNPLNQNLRYWLSILYDASGDRRSAVKELKRISLIDSNTFIALKARRFLNTLEFLQTL